MKKQIATILTTLFLTGQIFAQEIPTSDFFTQIKDYDLSVAIASDSIFIDEDMMIERPELLGFIGDNYQRFHIHFISIIQNPFNPYEYFAYGKTKVKNNICEFQGTIKITKARRYIEGDIPTYKQGYAECEVNLYEESKQNSTGFFSGKLSTGFVIDDKGVFRYDAVAYVADGYSNNEFIGTWTSYKTKSTKKCNWGDRRIPESKELDIGDGDFMIDDKYVKNGWENYKLAWNTYPETPAVIKARQKENEKWWK